MPMQIVFFIVFMRQNFEELRRFWCFGYFHGQLPQFRRPDANHGFRIDRRHEFALKVPVCLILQFKQASLNGFFYFAHFKSQPRYNDRSHAG